MLRLLVLLFTVVYGSYAPAQNTPELQAFDPDDVLVAGDKLPQVLLVGTFHFDYPNLDAHVTSAEDRVDVKDAQRQAEVRELLDYLARFRPNKIVVERQPGSSVNDQYRSYLAGERELRADEIEQLAFRLGKQFGLDSLVMGDAAALSYTLSQHPDSTVLHPLLDRIFANEESDNAIADTINSRYFELYRLEDRMDTQQTLLEIFRYNNRPDRIRRGHGHYLQFTSDRSADALALWWYSRNLRIFRNIQRAATSPDDRILVLFGAGHLGILRQQLQSTPAMELVEFGDL